MNKYVRRVPVALVGIIAAVVVMLGSFAERGAPAVEAHTATGTPHLEIDADPTNGTRPCDPVDTTASVISGSTYQVALCVADYTPNTVTAFGVRVNYSNNATAPEVANVAPYLNDNPDANDGDDPTGFKLGDSSLWACDAGGTSLILPMGDDPATPGVKDAVAVCNTSLATPDPDLTANPGLLYTITFTADSSGPNVLTIDGSSDIFGEPCNGGNINCFGATVNQLPAADLFIQKSVTPDPSVAGANAVYTLAFGNNGPDTATNISIIDDLPDDKTFLYGIISGSDPMNPANHVCTLLDTDPTYGPIIASLGLVNVVGCAWLDLNQGDNGAIDIAVSIPADQAGKPEMNVATITSGNIVTGAVVPDPDVYPLSFPALQNCIANSWTLPGGTCDNAAVLIHNNAPSVVTVDKVGPAAPTKAGDPITWTITVTSNGPSTAANVTVHDVALDGFTITGQGQSGGSVTCSLDGTTATTADWTCGDMAAGDTAVLTVSGTVNDPNPADQTCDNEVTVTWDDPLTVTDTATASCTPRAVRMIKDVDGDPTTDDSLVNLWLCTDPTECTTNGQGFLDIQEMVLNVSGDPDGVGAFEFQLKYDHKIFDISIEETDWLYDTGRIPGAPGIGGCAASIVNENAILFGCVSKDDPATPGIQPGNTADGTVAIIHVLPEADLIYRLHPGQENGVIRVLLNENCELADIFGDPLSFGVDSLGRPILLDGIVDGGLVADCADIAITVRILEADVDLDCDVDVLDDQAVAFRYGSSFGSLFYDPWFDLEPALKDFDVDIKDLQKVFGRNGSTCENPIPDQDPETPPQVDPFNQFGQ